MSHTKLPMTPCQSDPTADSHYRPTREPDDTQPPTTDLPRVIKPRKRNLKDDLARHFQDEEQDSLTIIRHNRSKSLSELGVTDPWHGSMACDLLSQLPQSYIWIPTYIARAANHPVRARVLAWLVDKFDTALDGLCRARIIAEDGTRWWISSISTIAKETLLHERAIERSLRALSRATPPLIRRESAGHDGTRLQPHARSLIAAYYEVTKDADATEELKCAGDNLQWWDSLTRLKTTRTSNTGVSVHDALTVICDYRPGPAALLATILYWHSLDAKGLPRARITRDGYLWIAKSWRQLSQEMGHDGEAIKGWRDWLTTRGFVRTGYWRYDSRRDYGRETVHLRPDPQEIGEALNTNQRIIEGVISAKRRFLNNGQ